MHNENTLLLRTGQKLKFLLYVADRLKKFELRVITLLWNNALWLFEIHHVTSNSQSKCWILE